MENNKICSIVKEKFKLKQKSESVNSDDDVEVLKEILSENIMHHEGIGLSAIQLDIPKRVCLINVKDPIFLVNPEIVERNGSTKYVEGCLSFPGDVVATERNTEILIEADNYDGRLHFSPDEEDFIDKDYENTPEMEDDVGLLECVVAQHEIDHLNGILMFDRRVGRGNTYEKDYEFQRNDYVKIKNRDTGEKTQGKYKYIYDKVQDNKWEVIEVN